MPTKIPEHLLPFHDVLLDGLDFCRLAYNYFDEVMSKPDNGHEFRERRGPIKDLMEEILPLCRYIQTFYGPGQYISIRWTGISGTPDATFIAAGTRVQMDSWPSSGYLEVTTARHPKEHIALEILNEKGMCFGLDGLQKTKQEDGKITYLSEVVSYDHSSQASAMAGFILKAIDEKVVKYSNGRYPDGTTLIVNCLPTTILYRTEWEQIVDEVRSNMEENPFKSTFLIADSYPYSAVL